jgi:hypothetical protein
VGTVTAMAPQPAARRQQMIATGLVAQAVAATQSATALAARVEGRMAYKAPSALARRQRSGQHGAYSFHSMCRQRLVSLLSSTAAVRGYTSRNILAHTACRRTVVGC